MATKEVDIHLDTLPVPFAVVSKEGSIRFLSKAAKKLLTALPATIPQALFIEKILFYAEKNPPPSFYLGDTYLQIKFFPFEKGEDMLLILEPQEKTPPSKEEIHFAHFMAHELRTPLAAITGLAGLLKNEASLQPKQKNWVENILQAASDMNAEIQAIATYLTPPKTVIKKLHFNKIWEEKKRWLHLPSFLEKVEFDESSLEKDYWVFADETELLQALKEIVFSALMHSEDKKISLHLQETLDLKIEITTKTSRLKEQDLQHLFFPTPLAEAKQLHLLQIKKFAKNSGGNFTVTLQPPYTLSYQLQLPRIL